MSRLLVPLAVVCAFAVAAQAGVITHGVAYEGSYVIEGNTIDVWTVSFTADPNRTVGALVLNVGSNVPDPNLDPNDPNAYDFSDDPFQVGYKYWQSAPPPGHEEIMLTPTADSIAGWGLPWEEADSHFLPSGIAGWSPRVVDPNEVNDGSIKDVLNDYYLGVGYLEVATAVPEALRTRSIDAIQVGVVSGTEVWCWTGSADDTGEVTEETFLIPEPATLTLLGLGALGLIRRRR